MDPNVWPDGARPQPISLIMSLTNTSFDELLSLYVQLMNKLNVENE
jgi:hypothetical protein